MNNKILNVAMFTIGAAVGSVVTWKIVSTRYERIVQAEIDSVKAEYATMVQTAKQKAWEEYDNTGDSAEENQNEGEPDSNEQEVNEEDQERIDYCRIARRYQSSNDYGEEGGSGDSDDEDEEEYVNKPYVISPDEFASNPPGYATMALEYYADGVLADGWGEILDVEKTIGEGATECFGDYVDDIVYVRNEREQVDYEITKDPRTYAEATLVNNPYQHV